MAKNAKGVEAPQKEQANNQPTYEQIIQVANQLSQQNKILKERVITLEGELSKFANNYQRIVFLQETLKLYSESKVEWKGLFGITKFVEALCFDDNVIKGYIEELIELLKENKEIPARAKEVLTPKKEDDGNPEQTKE